MAGQQHEAEFVTRFSQEQLFDDDWCVDQIASQPDVESSVATTIELAWAQLRAERKRRLRVVDGGGRDR
jgi:hypothetical protein